MFSPRRVLEISLCALPPRVRVLILSRLGAPWLECYTYATTEAPLRTKLSSIGDSLGVVIEKPMLELLDIDRDTELEVTTDGHRLIITPVATRRARVLAASKRVMDAHDETFRKLAK